MKIFKNIAFIFAFTCLTVGVLPAQDRETTLLVTPDSYDFGVVARSESRNMTVTVTNTGTTPLLLTDVRVTCNCIRLRWPKKPIVPGESAEIGVTYRSRDRGAFYKEIKIITNASPDPFSVWVKGVVE